MAVVMVTRPSLNRADYTGVKVEGGSLESATMIVLELRRQWHTRRLRTVSTWNIIAFRNFDRSPSAEKPVHMVLSMEALGVRTPRFKLVHVLVTGVIGCIDG